jgi:hypothetical protein
VAHLVGQRLAAYSRKVEPTSRKVPSGYIKTKQALACACRSRASSDRGQPHSWVETRREKVTSLRLILRSYIAFRAAFDRARLAAAEKNPELAADIRDFQFRDLQAKVGTDKEEHHGMEATQSQSGHASPSMTKQYLRHQKGKLVIPTK